MSSDQIELQRVLSADTHPDVKLLLESRVVTISAMIALRLARGGRYDWCGSRHRVRKMRPIHTHRWQACYRTTQAATLQPSIEWLRGASVCGTQALGHDHPMSVCRP